MHSTSSASPLARWLLQCASVSTAYVLVCAVFGYWYYLTYGQWPRGDARPTVQEVHFPVLEAAVLCLLMAQFVTVPLCLALLPAVRVKSRLIALYTLAALGAAFVTTYSSFMNWYFD